MVENLTSYFNIWPFVAFTETMVTLEINLIGQTIMVDESLNNFQQVFVSPGKTGTAQTNYYFPPMVHRFLVPFRKDIKENSENRISIIIILGTRDEGQGTRKSGTTTITSAQLSNFFPILVPQLIFQ